MPKYKVKFHDTYIVKTVHEVEANDKEDAEDIACQLHAEAPCKVNTADDFVEWELIESELID